MRSVDIFCLTILLVSTIVDGQRHKPPHHQQNQRPPPDGILARLQCPVCDSSISFLTTITALQQLTCRDDVATETFLKALATQYVPLLDAAAGDEEGAASSAWTDETERRAVAMRSLLLSYMGLEPSWIHSNLTNNNNEEDAATTFFFPPTTTSLFPNSKQFHSRNPSTTASFESVPVLLAKQSDAATIRDSCMLKAYDLISRPQRTSEGEDKKNNNENGISIPFSTLTLEHCWRRLFSVSDHCERVENEQRVLLKKGFVEGVWREMCEDAVVWSFPAVESPVPSPSTPGSGSNKASKGVEEDWERAKLLAKKERATSLGPQVLNTLRVSCTQVLHHRHVADNVVDVITKAVSKLELPSAEKLQNILSQKNVKGLIEEAAIFANALYQATMQSQEFLCSKACMPESGVKAQQIMRRPKEMPSVPHAAAFNAIGGRQRLHLRHLLH